MSKNKFTKSTVSSAVLLSLLSTPLFAQQDDQQEAGLEVIQVTAQKRSENIQEVPIAITAFSEGDIEKMGVSNINDLGLLTPGLETNNATATQTSFNIRGITTNDFGIGLDAAVAVYIDGVYVGRRGTSNMNVNDIERVEVLKGPQGTLFGRNSAAGAIHIISKEATADNESSVKFTLGSHDKKKVELSTNFMINETMNFRGGLVSNYRGGYLDEVGKKEKYGNQRDFSVRGALHWDLGSDVEVVLRADFSDTNQQSRPAVTLNTGFGSGDPFGPIERDYDGRERREAGGISAEVKVELDHDMTFTSITAYRQFDRYNGMEDDGSAFERAFFASVLVEEQDQFSQEFRLTQNTDDFKWTLGATLFHENIEQETHALFNTLTFDSLAVVQLGGDPRLVAQTSMGTGVAGAYMTMGSAAAQQAVAVRIGELMMTGVSMSDAQSMVGGEIVNANLPQLFGQHNELFENEGTTNSAAIYFDGTYSLTDKLDITFGARYTYDEKDFSLVSVPQNYFTVPFGGLENTPQPLAVAFLPDQAEQENDWSKFTPRLVVDYQWTNDFMTYVSYAEGFKAGGFNTLGQADPVKEETVKNSEIGMKSTWIDNRLRLNLYAYQYDYTNLQQLELFGSPVPTYNLRNVDAKGSGFDIETIWQATEDFLITLNYGHTDTEYTKWQFFQAEIDAGTGDSKVGEPISGMPKEQGNVRFDYFIEGLDGLINLHASYAYTGDRVQGVDGPELAILPYDPATVTGLNADNTIAGYGLVNVRMNWQSDNHPINIALYVNNATDEEYIIQTGGQAMAVGSPIATPGLPRMFGIEFGMEF